MKLFSIPNLFTLGNLLCGCLAIVFAFEGNLVWSAYLVGIACVFDFLDGFLARKLNQHSPIGKELDSLADMVTFGVVPGVVMYTFMEYIFNGIVPNFPKSDFHLIPFIGFLIPLFSALRLAKFNIDTRQSDSFIGVPTPANAILICSLPLITSFIDNKYSGEIVGFDHLVNQLITNYWFLISLTVIMSILLIAEIPLFALKFKNFGWKGNEIRWSFLGLCVLLLATLQFVGIPLTIVLYILMSVIHNLAKKKV
ncbi:MAG TPA: CDP-diacylglycerol--serine O-phosphatidyltransferase [Bacteroidia bacterium]|nr:CDP-diacylglycerol--serine O-phosphatidyltransferase [Bacteroidia bacterium]